MLQVHSPFRGLLLLVGASLVPGCQPPAPAPPVAATVRVEVDFQTSASLAEADVRYDNGAAAGRNAILESLGGGVAVIDYDRDNRLDLCFPAGGTIDGRQVTGLPTRLLRQRGNDEFLDVSRSAGLSDPRHYSHGCVAADYDSDGFVDLLITGFGGLSLWRNQGDGTFGDATDSAGLGDRLWSSSAGWADVTGDGVLDLYVAHYVDWSFDNNPACTGPAGVPDICPPREFAGLADTLYVGDGAGGFRDASSEAGLQPGGKGLGVLLADFDQDGDNDIYVTNDTVPNFLYVNDGRGHFEEAGLASGVALDDMAAPNGSMGVTLTDFDADGWPDLWVTNYEDELFALYRNQGDNNFQHVSRRAGLNRLGTLYVGFGCVAGDFNADGLEDVAVANGHVVHHPRNAPVRQEPLLLLNNGRGGFARWTPPPESYFSQSWIGRGVACGDFDGDGRQDLVFSNTQEPAALLYSRASATTRSLSLMLVGRSSSRDPVGARAVLATSQGVRLRQLSGGGSYLSTSEPVLHWHVPVDEPLHVLRIAWPSGRTEELDPKRVWNLDQPGPLRALRVEPDGPVRTGQE